MNQYFLIQKRKKKISNGICGSTNKKLIFPDHFCVIARLGPVSFLIFLVIDGGIEKEREREKIRKWSAINQKLFRDVHLFFLFLLLVCQCVCVYKFSDDGNSAVWWIKNQSSRNPFPRMAKLSKVSFTTFVIYRRVQRIFCCVFFFSFLFSYPSNAFLLPIF